jgi:hypothetical protein
MHVPLTAYAEDCTFTGELALPADRLSDFLTSATEFELGNVTFRALDDGRVVGAELAAILRDDLCAVLASEPRGRAELRIWTRQYPVVARVGPYRVRGYLHAPPTIDPLKMTSRRQILALTSATIAYAEAGAEIELESETLLLNGARVEALEAATIEDIETESLGDPEDEPEPILIDPNPRLEGLGA